MTELLDGAIVDAANQGNWAFVGSVGVVVVLCISLGLVSWLKGRKAVAILIWLLIGLSAAVLVLPLATVQTLIDTTTSALAWSVFGSAVGALVFGFVSAARLARPPSWWAQRRYDNDRYAEAIERHHWTRPQAR